MFISPNFKQKLRKKLVSQSWENDAADIENGAQTNERRAELIVSFHRDGGPETATKMIPLFSEDARYMNYFLPAGKIWSPLF